MSTVKKQLVIIHGGDFFDSRAEFVEDLKRTEAPKEYFLFDEEKGWKDNLAQELSGEYEVFFPTMPNKLDAKYAEWKIWFDKMVPFLNDGVVLVGHSLGGIFFARYLSENALGIRIEALYLVAAPYFRKKGKGANKAGFVVGDLGALGDRVDKIFVVHSKDDPIVAFSHAERYQAALPHSIFMHFKDRGHFIGPRFPELLKLVKKSLQ